MSRVMKHSGIPWIGEIPKDWKVERLKDVGFLYGGLTGKSGDDFIAEDDESCKYMRFIPFTNICNNNVINPNQLYKVRIEEDEKQNLVSKNDILFLMSSEDYEGVGKPAIIEEQIDNLGLNSFCKGLRITNTDVCPKYLFYLLLSHVVRELVRQEAKGFIRINLRQDKLSTCPIMLPPLPEQQKIASFLDEKCSEIDEMIALQEKIIEELKAYKQSVITEAVTKGLNPDVPMKDSGIEWIGEIPENWRVAKLSTLFSFKGGYAFDSSEFGLNGNNQVIRIGNVKNDLLLLDTSPVYISDETAFKAQKSKLDKGQILFTMTGTKGKRDYFYTLLLKDNHFSDKKLYLNQRVGCFVEKDNVCAGYYNYLLKDKHILDVIFLYETGTANQGNLGIESIKNTKVQFPPLSEQQSIASYLDEKCSEIDSLISIKQSKIESLKEYKKSIIYEYVTGKKEVE